MEESELLSFRQQIDAADQQIINYINKRVELAGKIGHIKLKEGKEIYVPSREEEVFDKLLDKNPGPLPGAAVKKIYREIISAAISLEKSLKIAYLGPEATYTHQAALKNFGSSVSYMPIASVGDVFTAVQRGDADYGVVPIENSTQGTVVGSLDMLAEFDLKIVAQLMLEISHCLISFSDMDEIKSVHSKDNALGQCRQWLGRMLPNADLQEASSTAAAVLLCKEDKSAAAIASRVAADLYNVPIVNEQVCDKNNNFTRFLVIGRTPSGPLGNGRDKTSLLFTLNDKPGALLEALKCFSSRDINLCKIESRPSRRRAWDYYFYLDIIGHIEDTNVKEAFEELKEMCETITWLGSFPNTGV